MNSQKPNPSFPSFPSVWNPPSQIEIRKSKIENPSSHYWLLEPAPHVDPALAKRSPWYAVQHVFCRRDTGELVGIIRRLKGEFKTAWFSGNSVTVKRHYSIQAAKKFLERQFTRTVQGSTVQRFDGSRFKVLAPLPVPCRKVIHVNFSCPSKSKFRPRIISAH